MDFRMQASGQMRLVSYFERIGDVLGNKKRKASFAIYAMGLLGEAERKSMEPIAARASSKKGDVDALHQRLGHFVTCSDWSDRDVRRIAAEHAVAAMVAQGPIESWIIDDTGFLKQGKHSVGVQRQYTGSAGKIANCQIGVSLSVSTRTEHAPIDFELYLPREWTDDSAHRHEAKIPDEVKFQTKLELAMGMIDRALEDGIPPGVVLADEFYGNSNEFRDGLRARSLDYAVSISSSTAVWSVDRDGRTIGNVPWKVKELAEILKPKRFRKSTWRQGTGGALSARFATRRVKVAHGGDAALPERETQWLLMEWRDGEPEPAHFYLCTLPAFMTRKQLVRIVKERYRTERAYEDLKGELGLDHFEGRRFRGWHHHVSVALACYAFIIAEKVRAFPPSQARKSRSSSNFNAARTSFPGFIYHRKTGDCSCPHRMASSLSSLSEDLPLRATVNQPLPKEMTQ